MSTLTVVQMVIRNMERDKYASIIQEELSKLSVEFSLYRRRWDKLSQHIQTVSKDVEEVHITTRKISKRFDSINKVDVDKLHMSSFREMAPLIHHEQTYHVYLPLESTC